jgi:hypothetical protein
MRMPRVFRLMKSEAGRPKVGTASMMLGVRPGNRDIPVTPGGEVLPGTGGFSVYAGLRDLPPHMIPSRLQSLVPDAAGDDRLSVWAMGVGPFASAPIATRLMLQVDPDDSKHGLIEPDAIMLLEEYQAALAATQDHWAVDER